MIRKFLKTLKSGTEDEYYGRDIVQKFAKFSLSDFDNGKILDIGCGTGTDLYNLQKAFSNKKFAYYGIESYTPNIKIANENNIETFDINIEKDVFPFSPNCIDFIIANQVIEHTKEIFWIFSEISRILKPGRHAVIGVPNLASLHNRILLLFGRHPSAIKLLSAHVRGITYESFKEFIETDGYFQLIDFKGAHFYPFPRRIGRILGKMFPYFSVGIFFLIQRTEKKGKFISVLEQRPLETPYFKG